MVPEIYLYIKEEIIDIYICIVKVDVAAGIAYSRGLKTAEVYEMLR